MKKLTLIEESISKVSGAYLPYVTHNAEELLHYRSIYSFIKEVINRDVSNGTIVTVFENGCGVGYGCAILSTISNSKIYGFETNVDAVTYAGSFYSRDNVEYMSSLPVKVDFDYFISNQIHHGYAQIKDLKIHKRKFSIVKCEGFTWDQFSSDAEVFYVEQKGNITKKHSVSCDSIIVVETFCDVGGVGKLAEVFDANTDPAIDFPGCEFQNEFYFTNESDLLNAVESKIKKTDVVLDIGCGIMPMNYFRPSLHIMLEPWKEYVDVLRDRYVDDKSILLINDDGLFTEKISDKSVDTVFMLDVLEHISKDTGKKILSECERIAREQIVVFTPFGFMPQHVDHDVKDAWGLSGNSLQEHISGWLPREFSADWDHFICMDYHREDFKKDKLERPYGAFFAIKNIPRQSNSECTASEFKNLRRPLPSEVELERVQSELNILKNNYESISAKYSFLTNHPLLKPLFWIRRKIRSL